MSAENMWESGVSVQWTWFCGLVSIDSQMYVYAVYFANFWIWLCVVRVIWNVDLMITPCLFKLFYLQFLLIFIILFQMDQKPRCISLSVLMLFFNWNLSFVLVICVYYADFWNETLILIGKYPKNTEGISDLPISNPCFIVMMVCGYGDLEISSRWFG